MTNLHNLHSITWLLLDNPVQKTINTGKERTVVSRGKLGLFLFVFGLHFCMFRKRISKYLLLKFYVSYLVTSKYQLDRIIRYNIQNINTLKTKAQDYES